jgi:hypothetical protein
MLAGLAVSSLVGMSHGVAIENWMLVARRARDAADRAIGPFKIQVTWMEITDSRADCTPGRMGAPARNSTGV